MSENAKKIEELVKKTLDSTVESIPDLSYGDVAQALTKLFVWAHTNTGARVESDAKLTKLTMKVIPPVKYKDVREWGL